jgi:hypothetical protein
MKTICNRLIELIQSDYFLTSSYLSNHDESTISNGVTSCGHLIYNILLWVTRDVYMSVRNDTSDVDKSVMSKSEEDLQSNVDRIISIRDSLTEMLLQWMTLDVNTTINAENIENILRNIRSEAFRILNDLRLLFPVKEQNHEIVSSLAWTPGQEVFQGMKSVFDAETKRIKDKLSELSDTDSDKMAADELSKELIDKVLCPLGQSMIYDINNVNRRQAAAILIYLIDEHSDVQNMVKCWIKKLKEQSIVKYLEIQMVALKSFFIDKILSIIEQSNNDENNDDELDIESMISEEMNSLILFSNKLVQSMGVGKCKGEVEIGLVNFFHAVIDYSMSHSNNFYMFASLETYVKLLSNNAMNEISEYIDNAKLNSTDIIESSTEAEFKYFDSFYNKITGKGINRYQENKSNFASKKKKNGAPLNRRTSTSTAEEVTPAKSLKYNIDLPSNTSQQDWEIADNDNSYSSISYSSQKGKTNAVLNARYSSGSRGAHYDDLDLIEDGIQFRNSISAVKSKDARSMHSTGLHIEELSPLENSDSEFESRAVSQKSNTSSKKNKRVSSPDNDDMFDDLDARPSRRYRN